MYPRARRGSRVAGLCSPCASRPVRKCKVQRVNPLRPDPLSFTLYPSPPRLTPYHLLPRPQDEVAEGAAIFAVAIARGQADAESIGGAWDGLVQLHHLARIN